jgi:hypothetical protein
LYYTIQSNILVLALFILLTVATAKSLRDGTKKDACFYPKLCAGVLLCILLTLAVFWIMLAPKYTDFSTLIKFSNMGVHTFVPILMLVDYILFSLGGRLTKRDPFHFGIVPLFYLVFATVAGLLGATYKTGDDVTRRFPYFFIDYDNTGWMCAVYIIIITIAYIGFGFLMYFIDSRRKK